MHKRTGGMMVLVTAVLALMFLAAPAAQAACTDGAGPGVNWALCNFFGNDFSGADLAGAQMNNSGFYGVDFSGATLAGANMSASSFVVYPATGALTDFTGADLTGANMGGATATGSIFSDAQIEGLDLRGTNVSNATFSGAAGVPVFNDTSNFAGATCPDGTTATGTEPYCDWEPLAVALVGAQAGGNTAVWPVALLALFALLAAGTLGLWRAR